MVEVTNVIITREEDGSLSLESPQIPGLIAGWPTEAAFIKNYKSLLRDLGVRGQVDAHMQVRGQAPDGREFVLRHLEDKPPGPRSQLFNQLAAELATPAGAARLLDEISPSATGEYVLIACLATDTIGWVVDQANPRGDVLTAMVGVAEHMVAGTQLATDQNLKWPTLDALGWNREMTLSDLLMRKDSDSPALLHA